MKNHAYQNGRLLQTNKKFSALKQKQKEWITNELRDRYIKMIKYPNVKLRLNKRDQILDEVYDLIMKKEIWILLRKWKNITTIKFLLLFGFIENSLKIKLKVDRFKQNNVIKSRKRCTFVHLLIFYKLNNLKFSEVFSRDLW